MSQQITDLSLTETRSAVEIINVKPIESNLLTSKLVTLSLTEHVEVSQILLHTNETLELPASIKDRVIEILVGRVVVESGIAQVPLVADQIAIFAAQHPFLIRAIDEVSMLCTLALPDKPLVDASQALTEEALDQALEDSFPASDASVSATIAS
jgi:hypothetical protein